MKTTLRIASAMLLFATSILSAQEVLPAPQNHVSSIMSSSPNPVSASSIDQNPNAQMVACTDKILYVDRHSQANQSVRVGGVYGWPQVFQTFPGFTGSVTEVYVTMRKSVVNCPINITVYALNSSDYPTGNALATLTVNATSATYIEIGGALSSPVSVTNGFAVAVDVNSSSLADSAYVALHDDPENRDYALLWDGSTLLSANYDFSTPADFLMRPKISYNQPVATVSATPNATCVGTPINFTLSSSSSPAFYNEPWAPLFTATYSWNFGDAGTSTLSAPTHAYSTAGTFTTTATETLMGYTTGCVTAPGTETVTITGSNASVSIAASATNVCQNQTVNFSATPTNGGSSPTYVWKKNNIQVGTTSAYAGSTWAYGDVITCEMVSNATCAPTTPFVSNQIVMYTLPLAISSYNYVRTGLSVSFTSTAANAVAWSWNFGDAGTSASATPVHNYATAGTYTVDHSVTNSCGITTTSSINIVVTATGNSNGGNTGINDKVIELNVSTFPNPVNNELNIQYSLNHPTDATIEILNTLGQVVSTEYIPNASTGTTLISTANLSSGIYFVRFTAADQVSMTKIVRQ